MIYLDNASTTRLLPEVQAAMEPCLGDQFGNASSIHAAGRGARRALEDARETVAACLGADPKEVLFTSGATESNHLAILGVAEALRSRGNHVITSAVEHSCVLEACARLEKSGFQVTRMTVDAEGRVDPAAIAAAVTPRTILISILTVNHEVGTIQPISAIRKAAPGALLHTDAAQAVGKIPVSTSEVDLLTVSAHKLHGPKGVGGLWVRKGTPLIPLLGGGGQEFGRRSGTENVAGAVGLAAAMSLACRNQPSNAARMAALREKLRAALLRLGGVRINSPADRCAPHLLNVSFDGAEGEAVILSLDAEGVCVSSGSACASLSLEPSPVLRAMGLPEDRVRGAVRFSLSALTTEEEIDAAIAATGRVVDRLRKISTVSR